MEAAGTSGTAGVRAGKEQELVDGSESANGKVDVMMKAVEVQGVVVDMKMVVPAEVGRSWTTAGNV